LKANQHHEPEKERMDTLQATGVSTSSYRGDSLLDDADESGEENDDGFCDENGDDVVVDKDDSSTADNDAPDTNCQSLIFMFDCETTGLSVYEDHITELAAEVLVPSGVSISTTKFSSLCYIARHIPKKGF